ncbi:MAG TPA: fibronectin type III-like domain-contianing protein, partial [Prolixibacteraceae bacterium]|nr:fibronectin type III-like domain-contianing protein [Prolixibacteraceae bacterium]
VTNTGQRDGKEVVQLYIRDVFSTSTRPVKELKAFRKIALKAGESKEVSFELTTEDLKYYNHDLAYVCEPGDFELMIGPNSRDVQMVKLTVK